MNKYTKVDGHNGLVRSPQGAILNVDKNGILLAKGRKKVWKEQQEELAQMMQQLLEDKDGTNGN